MRRLTIFCLLLFTLGFSLLPPTNVQAQTSGGNTGGSCDCFCNSDEGAVRAPGISSNYESCRSACDIIDERALGCYTAEMEANRPENNQLCWTKEDCISDEVPTELDGNGSIIETAPSVWGGQESFCPKNQGYCFNPPGAVSDFGGDSTVDLGVEIGGLKEVGDISVYVEAIYTYLISAASILAVLVIMIAGVQYMMAGGSQAAIGKAKERMASALIGLTLIMSAYVIARLIDPRLVDFNFFAVPKIQTIVFLDGGSSCDKLQELGAEIGPPKPEDCAQGVDCAKDLLCGSKGSIVSLDKIAGGTSVTLKVGDSCNWSRCPGYPNALDSCISDSTSDTGFSCVSCQDIYQLDESFGFSYNKGIQANAYSCKKAMPQAFIDSEAGPDPNNIESFAQCVYHDAAFTDVFSKDACVELVYPRTENQHSIDCDSLLETGKKVGSESCRLYDIVEAVSGDNAISIGGIDYTTAEVDWLPGNKQDFPIFSDLCNADPCGFKPLAGSCVPLIADVDNPICQALTSSLFGISICSVSPFQDLTKIVNCVDNNYKAAWDELEDLTISPDRFYEVYNNELIITDKYGNVANGMPSW